MKILAVRGKNLASLQKPFEIDLDASPLREAGLFAITGATGAGKTTLLDAICLALFDAVPRFSSSHRFQLEENREAGISSTDPRNLLRQGTAEGYAEVDFRGVDQRVYRANWSVRRARNKPDGLLQAQTMSLTCLEDGQRLGDTRTDTKRAISEKLGLDYVQFCRSVLLAQGDFANFIRSDPKKRAELLERITGTGLYSRLSIAAHLRHKQEHELLLKLGGEREALELLSENQVEERQQQIASLHLQEQEQDTCRQQWQRLDQDRRRDDELRLSCERAQTELDQALALAAELRSQDLEAILAAQSLRPFLENADRDRAQCGQLENELAANQAQLEQANIALAQTQAEHAAANQHLSATEALVAREAAPLQAAEALDQRIGERRKLLSQEDQTVLAHSKRLQQAREALELQLEAIAESKQEQAQILAWRQARPDDERITAQWELWESLLEEAVQLQPQLAQGRELVRLKREADEAAESAQSAEAALLEADLFRQDCRAAADIREAQARSHNRQALEDMLVSLQRERERVKELDGLMARAAEQQQRLDTLSASLQQLNTQIAAADHDLPALESARVILGQRKEEAIRALHLAQASQDLAQRRSELLVEGEPCPLCGSHEHPLHADVQIADLVEAQHERVTGLSAEEQELRDQFARVSATRSANQRECASHLQEQTLLNQRHGSGLREIQALWRELLPEPVADRAEVQRRLTELEQKELRGRADQESARSAHKLAELAAAAAHSASVAWESAQAQREQARAQALLAAKRHGEQSLGYDAAQRRWQAVLAKLQPLFLLGIDQAALGASPQLVQQRCADQVRAWREQNARLLELEKFQGERASALAAMEATVSAARATLAELSEKRDQNAAELRDWVGQRAELLEGRDTKAVRDGQQQLLLQERQNLELTREAQRSSESQHQNLSQHAAFLAQQLQGSKASSLLSLEELNRRCDALSLTQERLRTYLAYDSLWCQDKQERLRLADLSINQGRSILKERSEAWAAHSAQRLEASADTDVAAKLLEAVQALEKTREQRHLILAQLRLDGERRQRHAALGPAYTEQERKTDLWKAMSDLIGSHDGAKFRKFAQSLTLDLLVHAANQHLRDLQPRYTLKRIPGDDLEMLVVDLDMADDERMLAGLSGGETFLVSLALALGLASLNAEGRQIESLFIDEGFGALDAQSLDTALDTLDQLQASGRQVGIISHVQAVADRVSCRIQVIREGNGASFIRIK